MQRPEIFDLLPDFNSLGKRLATRRAQRKSIMRTGSRRSAGAVCIVKKSRFHVAEEPREVPNDDGATCGVKREQR